MSAGIGAFLVSLILGLIQWFFSGTVTSKTAEVRGPKGMDEA